jgi:hypothetical protein
VRGRFREESGASFRTYRRRSAWDSTVGGVAAKVFDFAFTTRELPNMTMMGRAVSFIRGDIAFTMVLITLDAFFDEFAPHFGAMTTSVRFAGATEQPRPGPGLQTGGLPQLTDDSGDLPPLGDECPSESTTGAAGASCAFPKDRSTSATFPAERTSSFRRHRSDAARIRRGEREAGD